MNLSAADGQGDKATGSFSWTVHGTSDLTPSTPSGTGGAEEVSEAEVDRVDGTNQPPVLAAAGDLMNAEGDTVTFQLNADDPDGDTLTYSVDGVPPELAVNATSGLVVGAPAFTAAANSPYAVTVSVSDGKGGVATVSFNWTVTDTNRSPTLEDP